jgi:hypothetical protein
MAKDQPPNILLLFTDQHRLSVVGCYGETPCQTPNLDRLAETGVRYDLGPDPYEMNNLIDDPGYADVVAEMRSLLEGWMEETAFSGLGYYSRTRMGKWPY